MPINRNVARSHSVQTRTWLCLGLGVLLPVLMLGCQKTVLRPDDDRSQFDRYDQSRSQRAQPFLEDEFGRRTPNLSERLRHRSD
ncbi:MAG: hypothetical protein JKX70_03755 [Phycisphaerales bacterium]|nr:hypothetical protein [Phycisphaerales bacterium]